MPVAVISSRFFLCTSLYTAKKSYFALSSLSEFLRVSAGCSKSSRFFLCTIVYTAKKSYLALSSLSEFLQACAGWLKAAGFSYYFRCHTWVAHPTGCATQVSITPLRQQCQYALPRATRSWILQSASAYKAA